MNQSIAVPIRNLPEKFTKSIHDHMRLYSVTMLMAENIEDVTVIPCSGTLCSYDSKAGIVTARHVWEEARKHKSLIVMTDRGPLALKTEKLVPAVPQPRSVLANTAARIPDIAFLYLDPKQKSEIEGLGKVFYSIAKRANSPHLDVQTAAGYWTIIGNPKALLNVEERAVPSFIYGTEVAHFCQEDDWDYLLVNLNIPENPGIPKNFGGVSGGGVWRTMWGVDSDQTCFRVSNLIDDCLLVEMSFYQTGGDGSQLIAHGPNSIYNRLPAFLQEPAHNNWLEKDARYTRISQPGRYA